MTWPKIQTAHQPLTVKLELTNSMHPAIIWVLQLSKSNRWNHERGDLFEEINPSVHKCCSRSFSRQPRRCGATEASARRSSDGTRQEDWRRILTQDLASNRSHLKHERGVAEDAEVGRHGRHYYCCVLYC